MSVFWLTSKRIQLLLLFGTASTLGLGLCGAESIRNGTLSVSAWAGPQQQTCICRKLNVVVLLLFYSMCILSWQHPTVNA